MAPRAASRAANSIEKLRAAPWVRLLCESERKRVERDIQAKTFASGAVVCRKGEPAGHWIGILDGLVKVDTIREDGRCTTFVGVSSGGWLGEGTVLKGECRRYEVIALRESVIALLPRATFCWLFENSLPFNHFLIAQLNARLGQFIALVERIRMYDTDKQIAFCLAGFFDPQLNPSGDAHLRISQEELGRLCGVSRQLASRGLHRLEQEGIVAIQYGAVRVLDIRALNRFAGVGPES